MNRLAHAIEGGLSAYGADALIVMGVAAIIGGVAHISGAAAWIVGGGFMVGIGLLVARAGAPAAPPAKPERRMRVED